MHYLDSKDRSAELLRLAIPMMAQHPAPLHPITYAVWYDYLAGRNADLKAEVDAAATRKVPLGDELVHTLYSRHIADAAEQATRKVTTDLQDMLHDVETTTAKTGEKVSEFQVSLQQQNHRLPGLSTAASIGTAIEGLLNDTRDAGASLAVLSNRLQAATAELDQLKRELDHAKVQATLDALTGVTNRRGFEEALAQMPREHPEGAPGPCLLLIDLDHFKQINDRYGHVFGDTVLKNIAHAIRSCVKGRDLVARFGGEEFVVLLPATALAGAMALAEQIRGTIAGARIRRGNTSETIGAITVSIGVATWRSGEGAETMIERADRALYQSKSAGRNQVTGAP